MPTVLQVTRGQGAPQRRVVLGLAQRRRADELRALEAGPVVLGVGQQEVLGAGLADGRLPAGACPAHRLRAALGGDVDDVERTTRDLGQRQRTLDRLALGPRRAGKRMVARRHVPLSQELALQIADAGVVLGMDERDPAGPAHGLQRGDERIVVQLETVVGQIGLERGAACRDHSRDLGQRRGAGVEQRHVQTEVDDRAALGFSARGERRT